MSSSTPLIVGIRFSKSGKIYHFDAKSIPDIQCGDTVVVETTRGTQLGWVAQIIEDAKKVSKGKLKTIDRKATPRDLLLRKSLEKKEKEALIKCREKLAEINRKEIKAVTVEYSFDGSRMTVFLSRDGEEKIELKSIRIELSKIFPDTRIDVRQIGPRDVAKTIGGMGTCGLETRCCSRFLTDFTSISIRMAKDQGISLTPSEITGMCGRLRCCLIYEHEHYCELRKQLPKKNKKVETPFGEGKVLDVIPLKMAVVVSIPETGVRELTLEEIKLSDTGDQKKKASRERKSNT